MTGEVWKQRAKEVQETSDRIVRADVSSVVWSRRGICCSHSPEQESAARFWTAEVKTAAGSSREDRSALSDRPAFPRESQRSPTDLSK